MSTRSSARNHFPPMDNPELTIRRRSRYDPILLNNSEMAAEGPGDLPIPDLRNMEESCQPSLYGRGGHIAPIAIQATNFERKNDMIQQVQSSCQFHGLSGDDANKHLDKFLHVTQSIKVNGVTDGALCLYLFPHSLTHHVTAWFDRLLRNSINTFEQMAKMFLEKYFPPSMRNLLERRLEEYYDLIENMTAYHNDWDTSAQRSESSSSITSSSDTEIAALKAEMTKINKNIMRVLQVNQQVKAVTPNCETCGGPHSFYDCPTTVGNTQNGANQGQTQPPTYQAPAYQVPVYQAPVHQPQIPQSQVVTTNELTNFMKANDAILKNMNTNMTFLTNSNLELKNMFCQFMKMNTASSSGSGTLPGNTITNPKEDLKGITTRKGTAYPGPTIPTTSSSPVVERETEATKDTVHPTNNKSTEDVQPLVVPTESPTINSELVNSPIIKPIASPVSAPRPNQRPSIPYPYRLQDQKLRDKANDQREKFFQIFKDLNFNISFADALILMPKFGSSIKSLLTNKEKLCELARTPLNEHCSAVLLKKFPEKLGDPGKFLIPCDFLGMAECLALADLGASINLMPLSMWNKLSLPDSSPTCMTLELVDHLISHPVGVADDVFVKVGTFHFSADFVVVDFDADPRVPLILRRSFLKTRRALIDVFEEYSQEVLGFSDVIASGNPTPYYDPIISTTSPTLTPFGNNDFLLEEVDAFLALEDDPTSSKVDQSYLNSEGDILLLESFLNDDPSVPPPNQGNYLLEVRKELKIREAKSEKSSIDEPLNSKTYLYILNTHFWKEEDFEPAVQHQRSVNPKIPDVIKQEVLKLFDAGLIYSISDSPWRVCIDYRKLNEATRKEHFPLPFMDQMLERLARNQYYYFLDGFSGYFQIPIDLKDQKQTTFTCPYGTFTYRRMPFGLCNTPGTCQRCMIAIFHDMIEKTIEVFIDDFSVFGNSFQSYLSYLEKMLKMCEDTNLCLN
nr:hypothetical protein [Tanacetum cinerariifolium]